MPASHPAQLLCGCYCPYPLPRALSSQLIPSSSEALFPFLRPRDNSLGPLPWTSVPVMTLPSYPALQGGPLVPFPSHSPVLRLAHRATFASGYVKSPRHRCCILCQQPRFPCGQKMPAMSMSWFLPLSKCQPLSSCFFHQLPYPVWCQLGTSS